jgi:hypothetical protein
MPEQLVNLCRPCEQLEMENRLCSSETDHVDFMNHEIRFRTFDMWMPPMSVLFTGDNHTTPQFED